MIKRGLLLTYGLLALSLLPVQAQQVVTSGELRLGLNQDGSIGGVTVADKPWTLAKQAPSGLLLRDVAADEQFVPVGGTVVSDAGTIRQRGTNTALKLEFEATYRSLPGAIGLKGFIHDLSATDRAITVRFALPVDAVGGVWWQDLLSRETIGDGNYANVRSTGVGATGSTSAFPWGAISAAPGELCLGVPMNHFVVHRITYDGQARSFAVDFDFGLSPLTKAFPSRADFSLVIYTADPHWGFRSATAGYYALFPDAFVRRAEKEGLWMPFTDIAKVQDPEDFNFAFQEGAPNVAWDETHGADSFKYISPHWAMLWMPEQQERPTPEFVQQKLAEDLKSDNPSTRRAAEIIVNCAAKNAQGGYQYTIGQAHWAPHKTGYLGWYAMFAANADPDLAQHGKGPTTGSDTMANVDSNLASYSKPAAFLDGFYFDGVDERPLDNYAAEQFQYAEAPLTFSKDTRRPILCGAFTSYKFVKRVAEKMWASKRLTMANGIPSQFPFSLYYLDIGGSEQEPSIEKEPVPRSYLAYARALMYHKPLVLLYKPRLEERFDRDLSPYLVDYMNACLPYAAEPSLFMIFSNTDPSFYYNFWERPDWYNKYRSIFVDYVPLVKRLALAGWEPVTNARASDPSIVVERFGKSDLHLVTYNPAREGAPLSFDLEVASGLPAKSLSTAVNLVDGTAVPTSPGPEGTVRMHLTLAPRCSAVIAFAPQRQHLASFDLSEAARYGEIGSQRLRDKVNQSDTANFESDPGDTGTPAGFTPYNEGQVSFSSERQTVHSAPRATKVVLTGKARAVQSTHIAVQPGLKYRFSVWAKAELPGPGSANFYVRWKDKAGKDLEMQNSPSLTATGDWKQLQLEATAPANAATVMLALVGANRGDGAGTVWFDDPGVVAVADGGQEQVLLPVPPAVPPASMKRVEGDLKQRSEQLQRLVASAPRATDSVALCAQVLDLATGLATQARSLRQETPEYKGVAAALDVSARRLRRAGGILAAWQLALTGGGQVALGETPHFAVQVQAGAMPLKQISVSLQGEAGSDLGSAPAPFSLQAGKSRTLKFDLPATGPTGSGGRVKAVVRAEIAKGSALILERDASYAVVSPCETSLIDQGQDETGRVQRFLLTARNMRREKPLSVRVTLSPAQGFTPSVTDQTIEIKPGAELKLPITLTAGGSVQSGWRETTVKVTWEGGEQTHQQAQLFLPAEANLLKNAGFEESQGTTAIGWSPAGKTGYDLDSKVTHAGRQAVRVNGPDGGAVQRIELNQQVARPLGLRGWSRHERAQEVMTIGQTEQAPAIARRSPDYSLYVDLHYVGGGALYGQVASFDPAAQGWQFAEKIINVSKPIKDVSVYLLYRGRPETVWFDDVFLAEADPDQALLPGVKVATDSTFSGYATAPLTDGVTETESVPWDRAAWASADSKGEHWVELTFPHEVTLKTVLIYWAVDAGNVWTSRHYCVQAFVDGSWRNVATVTDQGQRDLSVHTFTPLKVTRLRLLQREGGGQATRPNILWLREIAAL